MTPQSNQRGIETVAVIGYGATPWASLNRTSVGLKHSYARSEGGFEGWPQSNQRGIETAADFENHSFNLMPQSNQRGIETRSGGGGPAAAGEPQSNQRGIETDEG